MASTVTFARTTRLAGCAVAALCGSGGAARAAEATPTIERCLAASDQGQADRDEGRYVAARAAFRTCADAACPPVVRQTCAKWSEQIEPMIPTVVLVARGADGTSVAGASVSMDGAPLQERLTGLPVAIDPGEHSFAFAEGRRKVTVKLLAAVGEKNRIVSVRFPPPDVTSGSTDEAAGADRERRRSRSIPTASVALGALGVAGLATFTYLGLSTAADLRDLERSPCGVTKTCPVSETDAARTRYLLADIGFATGVVALGVAAWLWLRQTSE